MTVTCTLQVTVPGRLLLLGKEELVHVAETSQLEPEPVFLLGAAVAFVLLLLVPLADAVRTRHYWWALFIFLVPPVGGIAWLFLRRRLIAGDRRVERALR